VTTKKQPYKDRIEAYFIIRKLKTNKTGGIEVT